MDFLVGTVPGPHGSPVGSRGSFRGSSGELLRPPGTRELVYSDPDCRISCFLFRKLDVGLLWTRPEERLLVRLRESEL